MVTDGAKLVSFDGCVDFKVISEGSTNQPSRLAHLVQFIICLIVLFVNVQDTQSADLLETQAIRQKATGNEKKTKKDS